MKVSSNHLKFCTGYLFFDFSKTQPENQKWPKNKHTNIVVCLFYYNFASQKKIVGQCYTEKMSKNHSRL